MSNRGTFFYIYRLIWPCHVQSWRMPRRQGVQVTAHVARGSRRGLWGAGLFRSSLIENVLFFRQSTCMMRFCCGRNREFTMKMNGVNASGQAFTYIIIDRPFKCTLNFICCVVNPQELTIKNGMGAVVGTVIQDYRCFPALCVPGLTFFYKVLGAAGDARWTVRLQYPTICNSCRNCCAPTCFNRVFTIDVFHAANETAVVGSMRVVWPGWSCRW